MQTFAEQLAAARKAAGMTQEELSEAIHVARNSISSWEHGRRQPDVETLRVLSQVLNFDFLNGETKSQGEETAESQAPATIDNVKSDGHILQTGGGVKPAPKNQKKMIICTAALAAVAIALLLLLPVLRNKPVTEVKDTDGNVYRVADFQKVTPNEAGKAYITIDTATETTQGDNTVYWMYTFTMREDNGIDFHIDRMENIWIKKDGAHPFIFGETDLKNAEVGPDIPALQKVSFDGGMPKDQTNMIGVGLRLYGHDAKGEELTFTAYIPFPQD